MRNILEKKEMSKEGNDYTEENPSKRVKEFLEMKNLDQPLEGFSIRR